MAFSEKYEDFRKHLKERGWSYLDGGSFRSVYFHDKHSCVIKIPINEDGELDNIMEAKAWRKYKSQPTDLGILLAPCRLLANGCLLMVSVNTDTYHRPSWDYTTNGCGTLDKDQAGLYKGRVVAYDYGLDLTERLSWEHEMDITESFFQDDWAKYRPHLQRHK